MATVTNFCILSSPKTKQASLAPTATILPSLPAATAAFPAKASWGIRRVCGKPNLRERELHSGPRRVSVVTRAVRKLEESETISIEAESTGQVPSLSGVYAVYDNEGTLQFIGISRNIAASVSTHLKTVRHLCSSVKVGILEDPDRSALVDAWKSWMEEHIAETGNVPPGNESGNSTWVRQPAKAKPDLRLTPGHGKQLTVPLEELIDKLVKEIEVVVFIKGSRNAPQCGFSQRVLGILNSHGVDYESVNVLDEEYNFGLREALKEYSNWPTFPQIFVRGELIGGADILASMEEKGELASLFNK
ncbi:bifunctional monothiol glutaredoxin-S16, chloroplastic [Nymphaea colorata]|nr:bifunctional monothiol glutaredoxin-S16, chloroplastic [Nymphaea colorata]